MPRPNQWGYSIIIIIIIFTRLILLGRYRHRKVGNWILPGLFLLDTFMERVGKRKVKEHTVKSKPVEEGVRRGAGYGKRGMVKVVDGWRATVSPGTVGISWAGE